MIPVTTTLMMLAVTIVALSSSLQPSEKLSCGSARVASVSFGIAP